MAAGGMSTVSPPPGATPPAPPQAPPSSQQAAPTQGSPSPQVEQGSRLVIQTVQALRQLGSQFPAAQPEISQINDLMRRVQLKVMSGSKPTEPTAPPVPSA